MGNNNYIETEMHLRARAEYEDRNHKNGVYLQGIMSLNQALRAFQTFGEVRLIQQYVEGKRKVVWTKENKWGELELTVK